MVFSKQTFGSSNLFRKLRTMCGQIDSIEFCGVCTDICVVSNALMARMALPNTPIYVNASCCAGTTVENHYAALDVMESCQIDVIEEE